MKRLMLIVTAAFLLGGSALAQSEEPRTISGGVLNGKATSLPKPAYPADAKAALANGVVAVDVEIDENGTVVSAAARADNAPASSTSDGMEPDKKSVHPSLLAAAEEAARAAKFSPTLLSGQAVRVKGTIFYSFVPEVDDPTVTGKKVSGGVLNSRASSLPKPDYPPAAQAVKAEGTVNVQVAIDEQGNVISAQAVSGHPLLRESAVRAAREAKFAPTQLSGQAVKVVGVLTYKFVADKGEKPAN